MYTITHLSDSTVDISQIVSLSPRETPDLRSIPAQGSSRPPPLSTGRGRDGHVHTVIPEEYVAG